jgi:type II secretory pathway component PulM
MRLTQLWYRLSTRERTLAGAAIVALLLVFVRYGIVDPYIAYTTRLEEQIEQDIQRVSKMQRQRDRAASISEQVRVLQQRFLETKRNLLPGDTPYLAAANLQERIQKFASESGLEVVTTQVMRDEPLGEFRKAAVQVTLRGSLSSVANFLAGVEYGDWRLAVSTLEVRGTYGIRAARRGIQQNFPLTITLEVSGVMRGAESGVATQEQ